MVATDVRTMRLPTTAALLAMTSLLLLGAASTGRPRTSGTGSDWWQGWTAGLDAPASRDPVDAAGPVALGVPLQLLGALALLALVLLLARRLARHVRVRRPRAVAGAPTGTVRRALSDDMLALAVAQAASTGAADLAVAGARSPWSRSDAVIAAWVGLEEAAAAAGSHRRGHDTAAEFARDLVTRWPPVTTALHTLLELYARARFSDKQMDATDGRRAHAALGMLHRELIGDGEHADQGRRGVAAVT